MKAIKKIKVENMTSNAGNAMPNQFIIITPDGIYFQSYNSLIAFRDNEGNTTLDRGTWDYSTTTGKYRNMFLNENKKKTQDRINDGTYKLANLN